MYLMGLKKQTEANVSCATNRGEGNMARLYSLTFFMQSLLFHRGLAESTVLK
jgi:hypothetical protein